MAVSSPANQSGVAGTKPPISLYGYGPTNASSSRIRAGVRSIAANSDACSSVENRVLAAYT